MRYCERLGGWFVYDGTRWTLDTTGEIERRAKDTARFILAEALDCLDSDERRALTRHAMASESAQRLRAMIDLARSEPGIAVTPDAFDADPWLFNVQNGTVDLKTGELREHRREDLLTKWFIRQKGCLFELRLGDQIARLHHFQLRFSTLNWRAETITILPDEPLSWLR
jgi:putative DNA primase/helicase